MATAGSSECYQRFTPYLEIAGPAIIKVNAVASANNCDISAGFDIILEDN
jgi:hypothetical protein